MFSSNSFNVCPHCGKANSLNARYCSSCGKQLLMPQEVVVCHRCHKTNSPLASFCGACGAPLRIGSKTKICPKCHREIDISANVCSCGYSFVPIQYTAPEPVREQPVPQPVPEPEPQEYVDDYVDDYAEEVRPLYSHKGGRGIALFVLIVLLLFAFLILTPYYRTTGDNILNEDGTPRTIRLGFLGENDKGLILMESGFEELEFDWPLYGVDLIQQVISAFTDAEALEEETGMSGLPYLQAILGTGGLAIVAMVVIFCLTALVHLVVCLVRIVNGKRSKRPNYFYLIMALLTTLWVGAMIGLSFVEEPEGFVATLYNLFVPTSTLVSLQVGYITYLFPVFFWLMFILSAVCKARKIRENMA